MVIERKTDTELILALDFPDRNSAISFLFLYGKDIKWVKVGLELFTKEGPSFVRQIADLGYEVFLDLKLYDIPNTITRAIKSLSSLPIRMLTLHASGGKSMMEGAVLAAQEYASNLDLLAVTVLTAIDHNTLLATGINSSPPEQVTRLGRLAIDSGVPGIVCSPQEITLIREKISSHAIVVTPGIRDAGSSMDDQKRTLTPAQASAMGSDFIVVGRPIIKAINPLDVIQRILGYL